MMAVKEAVGKHKCPKCDKTFLSATGLGSHMRTHGIAGSSASTLAAKKNPPKSVPSADGTFQCPVCPKTFDTKQGLSGHMGAHSSKPPKAERSQNPHKSTDKIECPECGNSFKGKIALANHRWRTHQVKSQNQLDRDRAAARLAVNDDVALAVSPAVDPTPKPERQSVHVKRNNGVVETPHSLEIDPFAFAIAVGQVKELCRNIAEEHDVPSKQFTRQFAELFLRQTRR